MEKSKKFSFNLPSRDSDDIADINQISDNFKIIEENVPSNDDLKNIKINIDQTYDPTSENAQSGKAVAEAMADKPTLYTGTTFSVSDNGIMYGFAAIKGTIPYNVGDFYYNPEKEQLLVFTLVNKSGSELGMSSVTFVLVTNRSADMTYNPESYNPQSGTAVAEAIGEAVGDIETTLENKQDTLVSGENIKTINGESILGEGNIEISGGGSSLQTVNKSGEIVKITDMAPVEQEAEITLESETVTDFSNVDVIVSGKNLFSIDKTEFDTNTITLEKLENNTIKIKSTSTVTKEVKLYVNIPINTPLVFSMTGNTVFDVKRYYNTQWAKYGTFGKGNALQLNKSTYPQIILSAFIPAGEERLYEGIQIEIGETQTDCEIPNVTHYTPDNQGVAENIKLVSPITNIFTNTIGVTVNVEYLAIVTVNDIEKMVEKQLEDFKQEITERLTLKSKVAGCKVAVIGDSITDGMYSFINANGSVTTGGSLSNLNKSPCQQIQSRYGFAEVINLAESGASYTKDGTTSDGNGGIKNRRFTTYLNETDLPTDLDAIIVFGGVNDFTRGNPLGSLEDAPSTINNNNFYSAVRAMIEYLTNNFMEKDIIFITPLQRNKAYNADDLTFNRVNTDGKYLRDYVNAIKTLCADYGVTCIDLYSNSKFYANSKEFLRQYMPDGTHPNADGTDRYLNNGVFPVLDELWLTTETSE